MTQEELNKALLEAAGNGDLEEAKKFLASGAQVDAKDNHGWRPLHYAAWNGHSPVVKYLVEELGAEADAKNNAGKTPIELSGNLVDTEIQEFLKEWASPENQRQMANVQAVHAHWKHMAGHLPKPGPRM